METNTTAGPKLSPQTEKLLLALRHLEQARTLYYEAFDNLGADARAQTAAAVPHFNALDDIINADITANVQSWAISEHEHPEI